jgi:hypothetical protein
MALDTFSVRDEGCFSLDSVPVLLGTSALFVRRFLRYS